MDRALVSRAYDEAMFLGLAYLSYHLYYFPVIDRATSYLQ